MNTEKVNEKDPYVVLFMRLREMIKAESKLNALNLDDLELDARTYKFILDMIPVQWYRERASEMVKDHLRYEMDPTNNARCVRLVFHRVFQNHDVKIQVDLERSGKPQLTP